MIAPDVTEPLDAPPADTEVARLLLEIADLKRQNADLIAKQAAQPYRVWMKLKPGAAACYMDYEKVRKMCVLGAVVARRAKGSRRWEVDIVSLGGHAFSEKISG